MSSVSPLPRVSVWLISVYLYIVAANSPPQQDEEVPVSPNPAYRQVTSIALQENSAYSIVHTVSPPAAAAQYKNIAVDDKLSESTTLSVSVVDKCLSIAAYHNMKYQ